MCFYALIGTVIQPSVLLAAFHLLSVIIRVQKKTGLNLQQI